MTTATLPTQPSFLKKNLFLGVTISTVLLIVIMAFSFGLHMYNIDSIGDANSYYTAAVKSMLQSWSNFFFAAAEPGGSVTVDKPPLGLWIETVFAYFLGLSGFSVSLPNILAGVFGIPLLYIMVKKYMGELAGLVAAFVMAVTPVFVATNRNNTMDGMLVFTLLLAAWAFIQATESGKLRWLLLGAFIVGLGFNIKMMQAFLPLPAFYALYFFGSKEGWLRKMFNLGLATVLLLAVSLSWAVVVDLTPAEQRPYIGSSGDNTVMGLITGHNGTSRLFGGFFGPGGDNQNGGTPPTAPQPFDQTQGDSGTNPNQPSQPQQGARRGAPQEAIDACAASTQGASCSFTLPSRSVDGICITPPDLGILACAPQGKITQNGQTPSGQVPNGGPDGQGPNGQSGGTPFSQETGSPGMFRFFTQPLSKQMSWLLPFALISVLLALLGSRIQLPIQSGVHKALVLWGGWLLTCVMFFSMISGIFHSYYAIMLAPALGAMVGIGFAQLWSWGTGNNWIGILLIVAAAITLAFQVFASYQYGEQSWWMLGVGMLFMAGALSIVFMKRMAYVTILASMMIIPIYWTVMTVTVNSDRNLPTAYTGGSHLAAQAGDDRARSQADGGSNLNEELLAYLSANTQDVEYLLAVPSSQQGAQFVIATGRPVLYMGGFGGQDEVVNAEDLAGMITNGELRYVLYGGDHGRKGDIVDRLKTSCSVVPEFSQIASGDRPAPSPRAQTQITGPQPQGNQTMSLYLCK